MSAAARFAPPPGASANGSTLAPAVTILRNRNCQPQSSGSPRSSSGSSSRSECSVSSRRLLATGAVAAGADRARRARRRLRPLRRPPTFPTGQWSSASIPISTAHAAPPRARAGGNRRHDRGAAVAQGTLARVETLDPNAQDARRLMSIHLPGLLDRYLRVPAESPRRARWGGQDRRRAAWSRASRPGGQRLRDISEKLARSDLAAFETQGRFIKSRYGEERIDG